MKSNDLTLKLENELVNDVLHGGIMQQFATIAAVLLCLFAFWICFRFVLIHVHNSMAIGLSFFVITLTGALIVVFTNQGTKINNQCTY